MPSYIVEVVTQGPAGPGFAGGTTGQVLAKASNANFDYVWSTVGAGTATWGAITGTIADQTDLQAALDAKAAASHTHVLANISDAGNLAALSTNGSATNVLLGTGAWGTLGTNAITNNAITNVKLADMAVSTIKGRATSGTGDPEDLNATQVKTLLAIATSDVSGLGTAALAATGDFATAAQGALAATAVQPGSLATVATTGAYGDLGGLPTLFSGAYGDLSGIPSTFAPSSHSHAISDTTGLQTALDAKADDSQFSAFGLTLVDDADAATARATIGLNTATINATIDGGGSAISTGIKGDVVVPFACTITGVTALADQTGSIVVDVWRSTYGAYPPVDGGSLTASAPITISAAAKSQDTTLTGWTTSLAAGDVLRFNVDSAATITRLFIQIAVTR